MVKLKSTQYIFPVFLTWVAATPAQIIEAIKNATSDPLTRSTLDGAFHVEYFLNYGCWCNFASDGSGVMLGQKGGNQPYPGRGAPKTEWDETCRALQWGYECAAIAGEERGELCKPHLVEYESFREQFPSMDAYYNGFLTAKTMCGLLNPGREQCALDACMIEGAFVTKVRELLNIQQLHQVTHDVFDEEFLHDRGFDFDAECIGKPGIHGDRICCGEIPDIVPYKNNDVLARDCCYDEASRTPQVYSTMTYKCCDDKKVHVTC